eukprot:NODE_392_length_8143_cov_0.403282.p4 type:complete len:295 gc:universal NODE_392_length_8143_cov_0.403282:4584-5468(+)
MILLFLLIFTYSKPLVDIQNTLESQICGICLDPLNEQTGSCSNSNYPHKFCRDCILNWMIHKSERSNYCAICSSKWTKDLTVECFAKKLAHLMENDEIVSFNNIKCIMESIASLLMRQKDLESKATNSKELKNAFHLLIEKTTFYGIFSKIRTIIEYQLKNKKYHIRGSILLLTEPAEANNFELNRYSNINRLRESIRSYSKKLNAKPIDKYKLSRNQLKSIIVRILSYEYHLFKFRNLSMNQLDNCRANLNDIYGNLEIQDTLLLDAISYILNQIPIEITIYYTYKVVDKWLF